MSGGLMLDEIIMNFFSYTTKKGFIQRKRIYLKIRDDKIYLYQVFIQDYSRKKIIADTKKTLHTHNFIEKSKMTETSWWFVIYNY